MVKRTPRKTSPEERLHGLLRTGLTHDEKIQAARELEREGEKIELILQIYPEYKDVLEERRLG